jgi:trk system potassium uptake protein
MKQFAIIGLGSFGQRMLEELVAITNEIILIDKDRDVIEKYKDRTKAAYITDAFNEAALKRIIPQEIDAVIVDLGGKIEVSIMTTNYLKKMNIREIIVKAQTDEHGEVLSMVGATLVVYPDYEAAKRITPMLASKFLFNYMPVSESLAIAEVRANEFCIGKSLLQADLRKRFSLNIVALRKKDGGDFTFVNDPSYIFTEDDILLIAGEETNILKFSAIARRHEEVFLEGIFRKLFNKSER